MTNSVSSHAKIGKNFKIGNFSIVHDNVCLGDNVEIGSFCIIGHPFSGTLDNKILSIGSNSVIRSHSIIYEGSTIGADFQTGHNVLIREKAQFGQGCRVGSNSDIEGDCSIGDFVHFHSYAHVGKGSKISDFVWIYSLVTLTNDPLPPSMISRPIILESGVVICVNSTVLPGTIMKKGSFASAATLVRGVIEEGMIVSGPECRPSGHVSTLVDWESGLRHPWMRHLEARYPESAHQRIRQLLKDISSSKFKESSV